MGHKLDEAVLVHVVTGEAGEACRAVEVGVGVLDADVALGHVGIGEALAGEVGPGLVIGADGEDPRLSHICSHQFATSLLELADRGPEVEADDVIARHTEGLDHGPAFGPDDEAVDVSLAADVQTRGVRDSTDDLVDPADQIGELCLLLIFEDVFEPLLALGFVSDLEQPVGDLIGPGGEFLADAAVVEAALLQELLDGLTRPEVCKVAVAGFPVFIDLTIALQLGESVQCFQASLSLLLTELLPVLDEFDPALPVVEDRAGLPPLEEVLDHSRGVCFDEGVPADLGPELVLPVFQDAASVLELVGGGLDVVLLVADIVLIGAFGDQFGQLLAVLCENGLALCDGALGIYYLSFELFLRHGVSSCCCGFSRVHVSCTFTI